MDRAAAVWRLPTTVADASERGIRVAMRLLQALQLAMCMCAGTTEARFGVSLLPNLGFLAEIVENLATRWTELLRRGGC